MDVFEAIRTRRSVRAYAEARVEEGKLMRLLDAARLSPSAGNRQEWKFVVVTDEEKRERLAGAAYGQKFVARAPVIIVACGTDPTTVLLCGQLAHTVDVTIACTSMMLEARELGLGTCWIGAFEEDEVKRILAIPESVRVVAMMLLGYPSQPAGRRSPRKSLDSVVCFETYR